MASVSQKKTIPLTVVGADGQESPMDQFGKRQSEELVIAFSGPIGCGIKATIDVAEQALSDVGYEVVRIKISKFIEDALEKGLIEVAAGAGTPKASRYERLQSAGNKLRNKYETGGDILAEYAITKIAEARTAKIPEEKDLDEYVPPRRAYLIDQLKHPSEVSLLRTVYRNIFYVIGVLSVSDRRTRRLIDDGLTPAEAAAVMERDRKEPDRFGQQIDKTLQLADFFIRNDKPNADQLKLQLRRFVGLMHGENGITPSRHEYGMYVAYAAGLSSACLSRQVGAALLDQEGNVMSSGRNDVPKFGGGLYTAESGATDARCVKLAGGVCFNDQHKEKLTIQVTQTMGDILKPKWSQHMQDISDQIAKTLEEKGIALPQPATEVIGEILKSKRLTDRDMEEVSLGVSEKTKIKDLIEFSRSIHAEMDALISVARQGGGRLSESTMYVTTFPCHSCARHIVTAGIKTVFYIEPYEKSLAGDLHNDSISFEPENGGESSGASKVAFVHFEGVAPRQYINMFLPIGERKKDGVAIVNFPKNSRQTVPEYLDDYRAFESKVVKHLAELTSPA